MDRPAHRPEPLAALASFVERTARCGNFDEVLTVALGALDELFGFEHSTMLMLDEARTALYTVASHGYERPGIGSEVPVGVGIIGRAAATGRAMRVNNLQRMLVYAKTATAPSQPAARPGTDIPLPDLPSANSQLAAPAVVMGQLVGVLAVNSDRLAAFTRDDEAILVVAASLIGAAIERDSDEQATDGVDHDARRPPPGTNRVSKVRFYAADGSTFVDGDYLVKGVAGRILWRLVGDYVNHGRSDFTNREIRLDAALELPPFKDNFESRLTLLRRRLEERNAPMRITGTGRGRFRLEVDGQLDLEAGS